MRVHRAHPHLTGDPCVQARPGAPPRWASRPGEPFADLPKCFEGAGQKEVSCAGQRAPGRAARVVRGGVTRMGRVRVPAPGRPAVSAVRSSCAVKMSTGGNSRITAWRGLMASKGLSGAAPVLEGYGLSCEHDLSLLVQEDLNALSSQLTPFHSRILRTWVQGLAAADQHHKRDKKRAAGDVNDAPAAKKHSNAPFS